MLSENEVVAVRAALERGYNGVCDIVQQRAVANADGTTSFVDWVAATAERCRLSYDKTAVTSSTQLVSNLQKVSVGQQPTSSMQCKIFLRPDLAVAEGSVFVVTQAGNCQRYTRSGGCAVYDTHQEVAVTREVVV